MEKWLMQSQSFCIVVIMLFGIVYRRERKKHIRLMSLAMIWDLILILQIELSRSAIMKASAALTNTLILNIHVSLALSTVVLYVLMIHSGRKLLAGNVSYRKRHRLMGWSTLILRIMTFATSFWAVTPKG
jgi:hypothetical protein